MSPRISPALELDGLIHAHPLGADWKTPELFTEKACVAGVDVWLAGLAATRSDGTTVTGSAGARTGLPLARAYGELLERTTLLDAKASGATRFALFDAQQNRIGQVDLDMVFPASPKPEQYRYSISNGTAVATTWHEACARSSNELIERDLALRSWYGHSVPTRVSLADRVPEAWREHYDFQAHVLGMTEGATVCVVAGFPRSQYAPLTLGFAANTTAQVALCGALDEAIQRLGFLWGEEVPVDAPTFTPTPDYHQEYYLNRRTHSALHAWLAGEHALYAVPIRSDPTPNGRAGFVELGNRRDGVVVVKCLAPARLPLAFGMPPPEVGLDSRSPLAVHPIA